MSETQPIRVLIVDDHAMVRSGLRNFLYAYDWIDPAGEAANGIEAITFCTAQDVDVVLMDLVMPEMDGVEAAQRIVSLGKPIKIIILTSYYEQDRVQRALKAGATSYLLKNVTAEELAQAIQAAYIGRSTLAPEATSALIKATRNKPDLGSDLTDRERQVLTLLVKGKSNSEIAANLHISTATAKYHLNNIYSKLEAKGRVEAVTIAMDHKLVAPD
jgi:two-component system, NarL family, response regulator LiaR